MTRLPNFSKSKDDLNSVQKTYNASLFARIITIGQNYTVKQCKAHVSFIHNNDKQLKYWHNCMYCGKSTSTSYFVFTRIPLSSIE